MKFIKISTCHAYQRYVKNKTNASLISTLVLRAKPFIRADGRSGFFGPETSPFSVWTSG